MKKTLQKFIPKLMGIKINATSLIHPKSAAQQAFTIFSTPRAGRVNKDMQPLLDPAKFEKISVNNHDVQLYRWQGQGKKILLAHGWESNTHRWHLLIPELQEAGYDIYALDAPGHGYSTSKIFHVPMYAQAIEASYKIIAPDVIVSHSIGALSTIFHQYSYPASKISAMVLLGSASELSEIMEDYRNILGFNKRTMNALEQLVTDNFGFNFKNFSGAAFAKALSVPSLIIHDRFDKITPVSASRSIHKNLTDSIYLETEGLGHSLYQKEVRTRVLKFLENVI